MADQNAGPRGPAFDTAFWWAIGLTALTLLPALLLPSATRHKQRLTPDKPKVTA